MHAAKKTLMGNFRLRGSSLFTQIRPYYTRSVVPRYTTRLAYYTDAQLINVRVDRATMPYYSVALMTHLRYHLPTWVGFETRFQTYVHRNWNSIYGDFDSEIVAVEEVEVPLLERDRLMQIFAACPEGSYGYYAQYGLAPFKGVVGSFAAATIDQFFASAVGLLKQPFSPEINDLMSTLETRYWNTREELKEWLAGKTFTKTLRQIGVSVPSTLVTVWEGQRKPALPPGEELESVQLADAKQILEENLDSLDGSAYETWISDLFAKLEAKGKAGPK